jgi:hypothetical protein
VVEHGRQLGDREDEDEVEEQLERRDPLDLARGGRHGETLGNPPDGLYDAVRSGRV